MRTIHQGHLPVRTIVLIGMVLLITTRAMHKMQTPGSH